jgi:hypothetical protein
LEDSGDNLILRWCRRINIYLPKFDTVISLAAIKSESTERKNRQAIQTCGSASFFDGDSDADPIFHFDAGSYLKLLINVEKSENGFLTFIHSSASLEVYIVLYFSSAS